MVLLCQNSSRISSDMRYFGEVGDLVSGGKFAMNVSLLRERENSLLGANGNLALSALLLFGGAAQADLNYSTSFDTPDLPGLGTGFHGSAQIDNAFGQSDLKLVSDGQSNSWGTWVGPTVWGNCTSFTASFEASFKNDGNGGPGDGFSFWFGDLAGVTDFSGGEGGLSSILNADRGMSANFVSYPGANPRVEAKQGVTTFASNGLGYEPMTYSDHAQAKDDSGHARFRVEWDVNTGMQIYVGWSWMSEEVLWVDAAGIRPTDADNWTFGFSARNGGINQDVFIDNLVITAVPAPGAVVALMGLAGLGRRRRRD